MQKRRYQINKKATQSNLPAIIGQTTSFDLSVTAKDLPELSPELEKEIQESDFDGYENEGQSFPIVEIRQKDLEDTTTGNTIIRRGGFKIYDPIKGKDGDQLPDVPGDKGLFITILGDQASRVYFPVLNQPPTCRSFDAIEGNGKPGGHCLSCPVGQIQNGQRSKCTAQKNLLVYDHVSNAAYVLRLGPSGLTPYRNHKGLLARGKSRPAATLIVNVTSQYKAEPEPHYVPLFSVIDQLPVNVFIEMKAIRTKSDIRFDKTKQVVTGDEEQPEQQPDIPTGDPGNEVPPGVEPVQGQDNEPTLL